MRSTPLRPPVSGRAPRTRRRWGLLAFVAVPLLLSGCSQSSLPAFGAFKSPTTTGRSTFHLWQWFSVGAIVIGVFTLALIVWAAVRYRARTGDDGLPRQTQYHLPLEVTYTIVPIVIVFALFAATVVVENKVTALPPPATTIEVYAFQWGWQFLYPSTDFSYPTKGFSIVGQTTSTPVMEMPSHANVQIVLQSVDVIHGFYIRKFNFSRYAQPGVINKFTFNAQNEGTFFGQCTQLCGLYHSLMWFKVKVVSQSAYETWLVQQQHAASAATGSAAGLAILSQLNPGVPVVPSIGEGVK